MDKAQEARPPDKASPGDPELLERGQPEQQVTPGGGAGGGGLGKEEQGLRSILTETSREIH